MTRQAIYIFAVHMDHHGYEYVWARYCRQHYQRARYRTETWIFMQCELLLQSLDRMQSWGLVESFELPLRRREAERINNNAPETGNTSNG